MAVENPCDIGVAQIISPVSAEGLGQESITVRIKNYADIPVEGFDVCYTVNGGGMLRISGEFSRGAIYTAGGVKVMDITTPTADISSLGHGLYIINIDGRGIKLAL